MLILISISSLSFLILVVMVSLRWFNCSLGNGSVCHKAFRKSDDFLKRYFSFLRESSEKYKNGLPLFIFIKKFLLFQMIRMYNGVIFLLRKVNSRIGKLLKKASLKKEGETVSEYLRNISDYKDEKK